MKVRGIFQIACAAALMAGVAACETVQTTRAGTVGVERQQAMLLSSESVNRSAAQAYRTTIQEAAKKGALNRDPAMVARVRRIQGRLVGATGAFRGDAPGWAWEINVLSSNELNAWAMPGGKMAINTGIIERLRLSDEEIAAILGHEMAHALREHGREQASQAMAQSVGLAVIGAALGIGQAGTDLGGIIADLTFSLPKSREHEREADRIGVELAARGGYNPHAAVTLWQKMARASDGGPPQFLSTHPSPENRINDLERYAARVMPLYQSARR